MLTAVFADGLRQILWKGHSYPNRVMTTGWELLSWQDGSAVKNTSWSCRRPEFGSQNPEQCLTTTWIFSSRRLVLLASMVAGSHVHIDPARQHTYPHTYNLKNKTYSLNRFFKFKNATNKIKAFTRNWGNISNKYNGKTVLVTCKTV